MNVAEAVQHHLARAAAQLNLDEATVRLLAAPLREIKVQIPVETDDGELRTFVGYRVQHDNARGPMLGGVRYHRSVTAEQTLGRASLQTWTAAVANIPFGGSAGGVQCEPGVMSVRERERVTRKYLDQIQDLIGPTRDILAPDVNTDAQVMAWAMDQYARYHGHAPAVATGKPVELYGSRGRESGVGRGVLCVCQEILRDIGTAVSGTRIVVQGLGTVGAHALRLLAADGARIVGVSDSQGAVASPAGLDPAALFEHVQSKGTVRGFSGAQALSHEELLVLDCDVLVLAALEDAIEARLAPGVRARVVVEAALAPVSPEADAIFERRGIIVVPDLLASAGGVTASYLEWVQNTQQFTWEEARVNSELEKTVRQAYERVADLAKSRQVALRTAAYLVALERVGRATSLRGL